MVFHLSSQMTLLHLEKLLVPKGPLFYQEHKLKIETIEISGRSGIFQTGGVNPKGDRDNLFPENCMERLKSWAANVDRVIGGSHQIRQRWFIKPVSKQKQYAKWKGNTVSAQQARHRPRKWKINKSPLKNRSFSSIKWFFNVSDTLWQWRKKNST